MTALATRTGLRSSFVNRGTETLPYRVDDVAYPALEELLAIYNPLGGPLRKCITYFGGTGTAPACVGHSEYYDLDHVVQRLTGLSSLTTGARKTLFAGGKGIDLVGMFLSSLGETAERVLAYLSYYARMDSFVVGTTRELTANGHACLMPAQLPLFSEEQYAEPGFPFKPFTDDTVVAWMQGERLVSGEAVLVPAQLVELAYPLRPDETLIGYSQSGGLSTHITALDAIYHGVTELIERDAVNLRWYCKVPPPRISLDRSLDDAELSRMKDASDSAPGNIEFYYQSVDIPEVPVVTAIEINPWLTRYAYQAGGGGDIDADTALRKALGEFGQSERTCILAILAPERKLAQAMTRLFDVGPDDPISKIDVFYKVIGYYGYRQNTPKLDWYIGHDREIPLSSLPVFAGTREERHDHLVQILRRHQLDPIIFDFTPPSMLSLKTIKVFMPELTQPFLQSLPVLGHPRFATTAQTLGERDEPMTFDELLTDPLPYP